LTREGRVSEIPDAMKQVSEQYYDLTKIPTHQCYLWGTAMEDYLHDLRICQEFAAKNREKIAGSILDFLHISRADSFDTVHNYIDEEGIVRKGAIAAHAGQKVIIPMNMRDGCLIAIGKGNPDWNCSAPHGAGRLYSRQTVQEFFTVEEFEAQMQGIYSTSIGASTLDESPMAYKPMGEIVSLISPTVDIVNIIKPIYNFKAG
jgi:RNA-splicing ligase RtcB